MTPLNDNEYLFTSESVTEGHPDKIADQISDTILDAILAEDPYGRVACETLVNTGLVVVSGEITTTTYVDIPALVRAKINEIGYDKGEYGFDGDAVAVISAIDKQSPDIAQGVDTAQEVRERGDSDSVNVAGAGDQGMMFGYASDETPELMPLPISLAHRLAARLAAVRKDGTLGYLRPDGKTQVTVRYVDGRPVEVVKILISTQHAEDTTQATIREDLWNQVVTKVAAALAAGCTVVLKPSEVAPLSAFVLAELLEGAGLPAGVFNLVTGLGPVVGEALAAHPDVDMVSFTGSTAAGRRVSEVASGTVKRVALELGGKSAFVVLDDADLDKAVKVGLANCFINAGQTCTAWTRMLVPADRQDEVVVLVEKGVARYTVGGAFEEGTRIGPLANANQLKRVRDHIAKAIADGATLVTGGLDPVREKGYFVAPTVFRDVAPGSALEQEEVFGPVLAIVPYDSVEEAVQIANGTPYGLSGGVFGGDQDRALAVARRLRTGMVDVNGGRFNPLAPFGGYKQSGNGRELGVWGLEEFLETKSLQL